jgi:hypothetical protein
MNGSAEKHLSGMGCCVSFSISSINPLTNPDRSIMKKYIARGAVDAERMPSNP